MPSQKTQGAARHQDKGSRVTFRSKLFLNFIIALLLAVGLVAAGVTLVTRRVFDDVNRQHTDAMVAQFQHEFERRGQDVAHRVKAIAEEEATTRMAVDLSRPNADVSVYVHDARGVSSFASTGFSRFCRQRRRDHFFRGISCPLRLQTRLGYAAGRLAGPRRVFDESRNGARACSGPDGSFHRAGRGSRPLRRRRREAGQRISEVIWFCPRTCARCCT